VGAWPPRGRDREEAGGAGRVPALAALEDALIALRAAKDSEIDILREHLARSVSLIDGSASGGGR
jgi:hypothetical protein